MTAQDFLCKAHRLERPRRIEDDEKHALKFLGHNRIIFTPNLLGLLEGNSNLVAAQSLAKAWDFRDRPV